METESSGNDLSDILSSVPFRKKQILLLVNLFSEREFCSCGSIFIFGHTATGKSFVLETIFLKLKVRQSSVVE